MTTSTTTTTTTFILVAAALCAVMLSFAPVTHAAGPNSGSGNNNGNNNGNSGSSGEDGGSRGNTACNLKCLTKRAQCLVFPACQAALTNFDSYITTTLNGTFLACNSTCMTQFEPTSASLDTREKYWDVMRCRLECARGESENETETETEIHSCRTPCFDKQQRCLAHAGCASIFANLIANRCTSNSACNATLQGLDVTGRALAADLAGCVRPQVSCPVNVRKLEREDRQHGEDLHFTATAAFGLFSVVVVRVDTGAVLFNLTNSNRSCVEIPDSAVRLQDTVPYAANLQLIAMDNNGTQVTCTTSINITIPDDASTFSNTRNRVRSEPRNTTDSKGRAANILRNSTRSVRVEDITPLGAEYLLDSVNDLLDDSRNRTVFAFNDTNATYVHDLFDVVETLTKASRNTLTRNTSRRARDTLERFFDNMANFNTTDDSRLNGTRLVLETRRVKTDDNVDLEFRGLSGRRFTVPKSVVKRCLTQTGNNLEMEFGDLADDSFFAGSASSLPAVSSVIRLSMPGCNATTTNASDPYVFNVTLNTPITPGTGQCSYWDDLTETWKTDGVTLLSEDRNANGLVSSVSCASIHLTNFAVVVTDNAQSSLSELRNITVAGPSIAIILLVFAFILHLIFTCFHRTASTLSSEILPWLLFSLIWSMILFLIGTRGTTGTGHVDGCRTVAVLQQFVWLCALSWSLAQAYALRVSSTGNFVRFGCCATVKYHVFAWLVPAIITAISIGSFGKTAYGDDAYCWINEEAPLIIFFFVPLAIYEVAMAFLMMMVTRNVTVTKGQKGFDPQAVSEVTREQHILTLVALLLGGAWLFGGLMDTFHGDNKLAYQWIFGICIILCSLVLLIGYCIVTPMALKRRRETEAPFEMVL